jgi:hypothetical protein
MSPGSNAAINLGCLCCPVVNNAGTGDTTQWDGRGTRFVVVSACPVHGAAAWKMPGPIVTERGETVLVFGKM